MDQTCALQVVQDVLHELLGDPRGLGDVLPLAGSRPFGRCLSQLGGCPNRVVSLRRNLQAFSPSPNTHTLATLRGSARRRTSTTNSTTARSPPPGWSSRDSRSGQWNDAAETPPTAGAPRPAPAKATA